MPEIRWWIIYSSPDTRQKAVRVTSFGSKSCKERTGRAENRKRFIGGMNMASWNLWHGCHKFSAGCLNCYVYRMDGRHELDSSIVRKTNNFNLPLRRDRHGEYKIPSGETVYTCFTSDFFLEDADEWRPEAWQMMRQRSDLKFLFITKRIHRMQECLPADWGEGYANVMIGCTVENQEMVEYRLPIFLKAAIQAKFIICE